MWLPPFARPAHMAPLLPWLRGGYLARQRPALCVAPLRNLDRKGLCGVVPKDVNYLDDDPELASVGVFVSGSLVKARILTRPICLPFVVKGVALIVPVNRPIVDPLRPI